MLRMLAAFLLGIAPLAAAVADHKPKPVPKPEPVAVEAKARDTEPQPASAAAAYKALDAFRASQLECLAAGKTGFNEEQNATDPMAIRLHDTLMAYEAAFSKFAVEYFSVRSRQEPMAGTSKDATAFNAVIRTYPWTPQSAGGNGRVCGAAYGRVHKIEWLEDLCNGGAKRFANNPPPKPQGSRR